MAAPLLDAIEGKVISGDALLTQKEKDFAEYVVEERHTHYHFTVKKNQSTLLQDISHYFEDRRDPDFVQYDPPDHGRIEVRKIWTTTELNGYLNFSHVGQAFMIQRETTHKKKPANPPVKLHMASQARLQTRMATPKSPTCEGGRVGS